MGPALPELVAAEAKIEQWVRELEAFWIGIAAPLPWLWAHGDYTPYNLVYRDGAPAGLLDFGAVQWAPAAYDVAIGLLSFPDPAAASAFAPGSAPITGAARSAFLSGYESERPLTQSERAALPMLARHRRVIAILWIAEECLAGRAELRGKLKDYLAE
jgi:Ser/Thr protein kinase RdoA (MazF antagonist)